MTITTERAEELARRLDAVRKGMEAGLTDWPCASPIYEYAQSSEALRALVKERDELLRSVESYQFALAETEALELQHGAVVARLQTTISNLEARDIHSCGPDCQRSGCVNRGLREQLAAAQAVSEKRLAAILQFRNEPLLERAHAIRKTEGYAAMEHAALDLPSDNTALREMLAEQWNKAADITSEFLDAEVAAMRLRAEAEKLRKQPAQGVAE